MKNDIYDLIYAVKENKENKNEAFDALMKQYEGSIIKVLARYSNSSGIRMEELAQEKYVVLFNSINTYDPKHNTVFNTWVTANSRFHALNTLKTYRKHAQSYSASFDILMNNKDFTDNTFETQDKERLIEYILKLAESSTNPKLKRLIELRYLSLNKKNAAFHVICKELGVSHQTAVSMHKDFIKLVKSKLNSNNDYDAV